MNSPNDSEINAVEPSIALTPDNKTENNGTILIVDDTPKNLGVLFDYLDTAGYRVLVNTQGQSALSTAAQVMPDLVLLDVQMPGMDGYEVCRALKDNERTRHIPVIFVSALNEVFDKVRAFEAGGVDYITKPFQVEEVSARVHTHLVLQRLQRELQDRNKELEEALGKVRVLSGLIPICANCKKVRDDQGYWTQVEVYIRDHSDADFSHGICPDCLELLYPQYAKRIEQK